MDYFTIKPTEENIEESLVKDLLGRNRELAKFIEILDNANQNLTLSLNGGWGSGKTFFVKQAVLLLNHSNAIYRNQNQINENDPVLTKWNNMIALQTAKQIKTNHYAVYYDAWENDNSLDPVLSVLYQITLQLCNKYELDQYKNVQKLIEEIIDYGAKEEGISDINIPTTKISLKKIPFAAIKKLFEHSNIVESEENRVTLKNKIKEFFDSLRIERSDRIEIFIDELDRCRPTFAVSLLERIKHYFDIDNITFVFSTNLIELGKTIECYYGSGFSYTRYFDKFFDLRLELNKPKSLDSFLNTIQYNRHFAAEVYCIYFSEKLGLELREIVNYLKTVRITLTQYIGGIGIRDDYYVVFGVITPLLIGLKMFNLPVFNSIIDGSNEETFAKYLSSMNVSEASAFYDKLLNNSEYYVGNHKTGSIEVTHESKLRELYRILFPITQYNANGLKTKRLGNLSITYEIVNEMLSACTLLSGYSMIEQMKK